MSVQNKLTHPNSSLVREGIIVNKTLCSLSYRQDTE